MPPKTETNVKWTPEQSLKLAMALFQVNNPNLSVSNWKDIEKLLPVLFNDKTTIDGAKSQWSRLKKTYMEGGGQQALDNGLLEATDTAAPGTSKRTRGRPAVKKGKDEKTTSPNVVVDRDRAKNNEEDNIDAKDNSEPDLDLLNTDDDESDSKNNNDKEDAEFKSTSKPKTKPKSKPTTKAQDKGKGKAVAKSSSTTSTRPNKKRSATHPAIQKHGAKSAAVADDKTNRPSKKHRYLADGTLKNASNDLDTFLNMD